MLGLVVNLMEFWHQSLFRCAGPLLVSKTELLLGVTLGPINKDGEIMGVKWIDGSCGKIPHQLPGNIDRKRVKHLGRKVRGVGDK